LAKVLAVLGVVLRFVVVLAIEGGAGGKGSSIPQTSRVLPVQSNPRAIAPSPTRVLPPSLCAFLGRPPWVAIIQVSEIVRLIKLPSQRRSGPPNSSRSLVAIPHARDGAKTSR